MKSDPKYQRLNEFTRKYVNSVNRGDDDEGRRYHLKMLLTEAIKMKITLAHMLEVLSGSSIGGTETEKFIEHITKHYALGLKTAADIREVRVSSQ